MFERFSHEARAVVKAAEAEARELGSHPIEAEHRLTALADVELLAPGPQRYLNRLSDLFFVLARTLNRADAMAEPAWRGPGG